jgi:hypothetical protein
MAQFPVKIRKKQGGDSLSLKHFRFLETGWKYSLKEKSSIEEGREF